MKYFSKYFGCNIRTCVKDLFRFLMVSSFSSIFNILITLRMFSCLYTVATISKQNILLAIKIVTPVRNANNKMMFIGWIY